MKRVLSLLLSILLLFVSTCTYNTLSVHADDGLEDAVVEVVEDDESSDEEEIEIIPDDSTTIEDDQSTDDTSDDNSYKDDLDEFVEAEDEVNPLIPQEIYEINDFGSLPFAIRENVNGDLVIYSEDLDLLARMAKEYEDYHDFYADEERSYIFIYDSLNSESNSLTFINRMYDKHHFQFLPESKVLIIPNYCILNGGLYNSIFTIVFHDPEYGVIQQDDELTITKANKNAPGINDFSVYTSGSDLIIQSSNIEWLKGIVKYSENEVTTVGMKCIENGGSIIFDNNDGFAVPISNEYYVDDNFKRENMFLSGDKIIISRDTMFGYNMPDGDYTLTLRSFGYKNVYDVDVYINCGIEDVDVDVEFKSGNIVITSDNDSWLEALVKPFTYDENGLVEQGGSIVLSSQSDYSNYFLSNSETPWENTSKYYMDGSSVVIPHDTLISEGIYTDDYFITMMVDGYVNVMKEVYVEAEPKKVPNGITVSFVQGKGLVISSNNQDYLNALTLEGDNHEKSVIELIRTDVSYYSSYNFSNVIYKDFQQHEITKEGNTVYVETQAIKARGLNSGNYRINLRAFGYESYEYPTNVYVNSGIVIPDDLTVRQVNGNLEFTCTDKEFLKYADLIELIEYEDDHVVDVYYFFLHNKDLTYNASKNILTLKSASMKEQGVRDGIYDIIIRSIGEAHLENVAISNTPYKFSIAFNANGGKGKMDKITGLYSGGFVNIPKGQFTKAGYTFAGWSEKANGPMTYYPNSYARVYATGNNQTKTLYAVWRPIPVSRLEITSSVTKSGNAVVIGGKTIKLNAQAYPEDAANKSVRWSVVAENPEDENLLTVSSSGVLSAKKVSEEKRFTVYATANDGSGTVGSIRAIVRPAVEKVRIYDIEDYEVTNSTITIDPEVNSYYFFYASTDPKHATKRVTWKSSNPKLAEVDEHGNVELLGSKGTVKITATAQDGTNKSASVTLKLNVKVNGVSFSEEEYQVAEGKSIKLNAYATPYGVSNNGLIWSIAKGSEYATINSSGTITAKKNTVGRKVTVRATSKENAKFYKECEVTITPVADEIFISDRWLGDLSGETISVDPLDSIAIDLNASTKPTEASDNVTWKSSNPKVISVNEAGQLTYLTNTGTAKITATTADGSNKSASVTIKLQTRVQSIRIVKDVPITSGNAVAAGGKSAKFIAQVYPETASNKAVTWSLVNPEDSQFLTISSSGVVTAKKQPAGNNGIRYVYIKASAKDRTKEEIEQYGEIAGTLRVKICQLTDKIEISDSDDPSSEPFSNNEVINVGKLSGERINLYSKTDPYAIQNVNWASSNKNIATVDENGTVWFTGNPGKVKITATTVDGSGKSASVYFNNVDIGIVTVTFYAKNTSGKWVDGSKILPQQVMNFLPDNMKKQVVRAGENGETPDVYVGMVVAGWKLTSRGGAGDKNNHDKSYAFYWEKVE